MSERYLSVEGASDLLERRWFAALAAAKAMQSECEVQRKVVQLAAASWQRARAQLAALEKLRDALGDELAALDERQEKARESGNRAVMSAA